MAQPLFLVKLNVPCPQCGEGTFSRIVLRIDPSLLLGGSCVTCGEISQCPDCEVWEGQVHGPWCELAPTLNRDEPGPRSWIAFWTKR